MIDFGVHFGRHFGAEIHENRSKIDLGGVKAPPKTEHVFGWLPTSTYDRFLINFGLIFGRFFGYVLGTVDTCTLIMPHLSNTSLFRRIPLSIRILPFLRIWENR